MPSRPRCRRSSVPAASGGTATPPPVTLVMAAMADKDVDGIIRALLASAALRDARVVCTSVGVPRAMPASDLATRWRSIAPELAIQAIEPSGRALDTAINDAPGPVVVAGSLYLVGDARGRLVDDRPERDPEDTSL